MKSQSVHSLLLALAVAGISASVAVTSFAGQADPTIAGACANCHKAEAGVLLGTFDNVAFKAKTIQVKIDDATELVRFDEDEIKVINGAGTSGDGELLKDHKIRNGREIRITYVEKDGVKDALSLMEKPPVKIPADMVMTTADLETLVARGPEKGKYFLYDSRPLPRFQEGAIPTAVNLPFPDFDTLAGKLLPRDKDALLVFYCAGPTCYTSAGSAYQARKLGYTRVKVYRDGMPAWSATNYGVLSARFLKEAWIDKGIPCVLLDARPASVAAKGFIKGAVAFPAAKAAKLIRKLPPKDAKAPIVIYDGKDGKQAAKVARGLLKTGYGEVMVLSDGFAAWQAARYEVATGKIATQASYLPKPKPGEINLDEFKKYAAKLPADVMIIDVRNAKEAKDGMLRTAKLIPFEELRNRLAEIPKDKLIVTQCSTGVRAEMAYHALKQLGYVKVGFVNARIDFEKNGTYNITKE